MTLKPQKIIVGNDRKNEVSALLHKLDNTYQGIEIAYMDDGIHSYLVEKSGMLKYTLLDSLVKTLIYGSRITTPKLIGSSDRIDEVYLYRPELRHDVLQAKRTQPLDVGVLQTQGVQSLVQDIAKRLGVVLEEELEGIKQIIFLPHPKALKKEQIEKVSGINASTAVKLHPRDHQHRAFFESQGIKVLDNALVAELIFLGVERKITVVGFASTALLMAKWLRPDLEVYSLKFNKEMPSELEQLMQQNGMTTLPIEELLL